MNIKIVADSSADITTLENTDFASVPLRIITSKKEYIDDANVDVNDMVTDLSSYKGRSSTACPGIGDYLTAFGCADVIFCITVTSTLSGSYNSAVLAKRDYEEEHPGRKVFIIDSLSAGPELVLIIEKIRDLLSEGKAPEEVYASVKNYQKRTGLIFSLESLKNLSNNGRVNGAIAKITGLLGIRLVGRASDKGDLEPTDKCRGEKSALCTIVKNLKKSGYTGGKLRIHHCFNENAATTLKEMIVSEFCKAEVIISKTRALCSFYAENGGMLIGYEAGI